MFGRKGTNTTGLPKQLYDFLSAADEVYMRAFAMKSTSVLGNHFSRECIVKLSRVIYSEGNLRFFCTDKFRTTNWTILMEDGECMTLRKEVIFDKIKLSKNFKMQVADNYIEDWKLSSVQNLVLDVVRVE